MKKTLLFISLMFCGIYIFAASPITWIGTTDSNWNIGANWSTGITPNVGEEIIIDISVNDPIISESTLLAVYATIKIKNGSKLTLNGISAYTLETSGNITINAGGELVVSNNFPTIKANRYLIYGTITNFGTIRSLIYSNVYVGGKLINNNIVECKTTTGILKSLTSKGEIVSGDGSSYDCSIANLSVTPFVIQNGKTVTLSGNFNNGDNNGLTTGVLDVNGTLIEGLNFNNNQGSIVNLSGSIELGSKNVNNYASFNFNNGSSVTCGSLLNHGGLSFPTGVGLSCIITGSLKHYNNTLPLEIPIGSTVNITQDLICGDIANTVSSIIHINENIILGRDLINDVAGSEIILADTKNIEARRIENNRGTFTIAGTSIITCTDFNNYASVSFPTKSVHFTGNLNNKSSIALDIPIGSTISISGDLINGDNLNSINSILNINANTSVVGNITNDSGSIINISNITLSNNTASVSLQNKGSINFSDGAIIDGGLTNKNTTASSFIFPSGVGTSCTITELFVNSGMVEIPSGSDVTINLVDGNIRNDAGYKFTIKSGAKLTLPSKNIYNKGNFIFEDGAEYVGTIINNNSNIPSISLPDGGSCTISGGTLKNSTIGRIELPISTTLIVSSEFINDNILTLPTNASFTLTDGVNPQTITNSGSISLGANSILNSNIDNSNTLSIGNSTHIIGDITNNNTVSFGDNSVVTGDFDNNDPAVISFSSLASTISGVFKNLSSNQVVFPSGSLTTIGYFQNNAIGTNTIIKAGAKVDIKGVDISGEIKALRNLGDFTIESIDMTATGTGLLKTVGSVFGSGTTSVQRKVDVTKTKWQLISSPLSLAKASVFTGHYLNEYKEGPGDFSAIIDKTRALNKGEGFVLKWDGGKGIPGTVSEVIFTGGNFTSSDPTRGLNVGVGNTYFDLPAGFNLVGNPYPSNLDWDLVYGGNTTIDPTYYYYVDIDAGEGTETTPGKFGANGWQIYTSGDGGVNRQISIGQGFGVVITDNLANTTLNIPNTARTFTASNGFNKKQVAKSNYFELDAVSNKILDKIYFEINENATEEFDSKYDAYKLNSFGYSPTSSFISADNKKLAKCSTSKVESIDMGFNMNGDGEVVFSLKDVNNFTEIIIEDKQEGVFIDLLKKDYTFQYYSDDDEFGRFTLHLSNKALREDDNLANLKIYNSDNTIYIKSPSVLVDVVVKLYNINGREVYSEKYSEIKDKVISTNLERGVYVLDIEAKESRTTQKVLF